MPKISAADKKIKEDFAKIKDKEIKLEADLAMADFADLEVAISELALKVRDYQKISQLVKSLEHPTPEREKRFDLLHSQLKHHLNKLSIIQECIDEMVKSDDKTESVFFKHIQKQNNAEDLLQDCISRNHTKFEALGFDPAEAFNIIKNNIKKICHPPMKDEI